MKDLNSTTIPNGIAISPPKDLDIWPTLKPLVRAEVEMILKEKGLINEKSEIEFDEFVP
jgi:hypothetical protein